jgi:excisionase family DNA binding protein
MYQLTNFRISGFSGQARTLEEAARGRSAAPCVPEPAEIASEILRCTDAMLPRTKAISEQPKYVTPRQVAELLGVDEKTILRWSLADPSMPVLRRGHVVRFHRDRLLEWLQRQEPLGARRSAKRPTIE